MPYQKEKIYAIYRIKSPSGKAYIGKDEYFPSRMNSHRRIGENPRKVEHNSPLHRAIRKYGWNRMIVEVVDKTARSATELKRREKIWIWLNNSKHKGYNQTFGGEGTEGFRHSDATKEKLRQMKLGKKMSEAFCLALSQRMLGTRHSEETKQKIAEGNRGREITPAAREKLRQLRLGKPLQREHRDSIRRAMEKFSGIPIPTERKERIKRSHLKNEYEFISPNGQVVRTKDIKIFAKANALSTQHLYHVLNGKRLHHKGWKGRYVNINGNAETAEQLNEAKPVLLPRLEALRNAVCKFTYKLTDPNSGVFITKNLSEFCKLHGLDQRKMTLVVNGKVGRKFHRGWSGQKITSSIPSLASSLLSDGKIRRRAPRDTPAPPPASRGHPKFLPAMMGASRAIAATPA